MCYGNKTKITKHGFWGDVHNKVVQKFDIGGNKI
jgi:hypothetical protein